MGDRVAMARDDCVLALGKGVDHVTGASARARMCILPMQRNSAHARAPSGAYVVVRSVFGRARCVSAAGRPSPSCWAKRSRPTFSYEDSTRAGRNAIERCASSEAPLRLPLSATPTMTEASMETREGGRGHERVQGSPPPNQPFSHGLLSTLALSPSAGAGAVAVLLSALLFRAGLTAVLLVPVCAM